MAALEQLERLAGTGGFIVESADGELGWVEEVWLDEQNAPRALAVCTGEGKRGLILPEDVLAVDDEHEWVVVKPQPTLLELAPPRLASIDGAALAAAWATTGETIVPSPVRLPGGTRRRAVQIVAAGPNRPARSIGTTIVLLYGGIAFLVAFLIVLAFGIAKLVTGAAY